MIAPTPSGTTRYPIDLIYSRNAVGKTLFALTASAQIPAPISAWVGLPPAGTPITTLTDVAVIGLDKDALGGLDELSVQVQHYFDLSAVEPSKLLPELLSVLRDGIKPLIEKDGVTSVILDTLTPLNKNLADVWVGPAADTRQGYGKVSMKYGELIGALRPLKCHVQILGHPRYSDAEDEKARVARMLKGIPDVSFKATGDGGAALKNDARFIFFLDREKVVPAAGKPPVEKVFLYARRAGYETKLRGGLSLPDKMDAHWAVVQSHLAGGGK